jgi:scyllo-inositol 2-dehydrogenase (NADP+)
LFGQPEKLEADIQAQRPGSVVDDYFWIRLVYPGMEAVLTAGMLVEDHRLRYIIHGMTGSFIKYGIDPQEARLRKGARPGDNGWGKEPPADYGLITIDDENEDYDGMVETLPGNYMAFYDNVHAVLTEGATPAVSPEEARNVIRLIELARESNERGEALKVVLQDNPKSKSI